MNLELYLFGKNVHVFYCSMQVVPILLTLHLQYSKTCLKNELRETSEMNYSITGAFTLLCHELLTSMNVCPSSFSFFLVVDLPTRLSARCLLSSRPDTASSAPVCCCHRDSLTRGRLVFKQEAVRVSSSHSPR